MNQGPRQRGPGSVGAVHAQFEQRRSPKQTQRVVEPGVAMAAAEDAVVGDGRRDARGHHQGCTGGHAVGNDEMPLAAGHQHHADHHGHLEAAEGGQHFDRIGHILMAPLRPLHQHQLTCQFVLLHGRAGDDQVAQIRARKSRQHQRCALVRTHADAGAGDRIAGQRVGDLHAGADGGVCLVERHGRRDAGVARAVCDLAGQQTRMRLHRIGQPRIDDRQLQALDAREHRDRQPRRQQAVNHASGRLLGGVADAVHRHAVVGGEQHDLRVSKAWLQRVLDQTQPHRQRLQFAEPTGGFTAPQQLVAQGLFEWRVGGGSDQRAVDGHGAP